MDWIGLESSCAPAGHLLDLESTISTEQSHLLLATLLMKQWIDITYLHQHTMVQAICSVAHSIGNITYSSGLGCPRLSEISPSVSGSGLDPITLDNPGDSSKTSRITGKAGAKRTNRPKGKT